MELSIMTCLEWQVQTVSASEIALYFLQKFWNDCLHKREQGKSFPMTTALQEMIQEFIKQGFLQDSCLTSTIAEISVSAVGLVFQSLSLQNDGICFVAWTLNYMPLNLVGTPH